MDNYLIDRETLAKFVDELMKKRTLPVNTAEEVNSFREKMIESLDEKIGLAIFGSLNEGQLAEINRLLDSEETSEDEFKDFFVRAGVNVEEIIKNTAEEFGKEFLGGTYA